MSSAAQFRYLHGVLLKEICTYMKIKKSNHKMASIELNDAFKLYANAGSLSELSSGDMEKYLSMIRVLCAREKGWVLCEPNEPSDISDWDMHRFLQYKLYNKQI